MRVRYCCNITLLSSYSSLTWTRFLIVFAKQPNSNVFLLTFECSPDGDILQMTAVLAFPPNEFRRILVSMEFLYGIKFSFCASAVMTVLSKDKDKLICFVSFCWSLPKARVSVSEPARSTKLSSETLTAPAVQKKRCVREKRVTTNSRS